MLLCRGAIAGAASRTGTAPLSLMVARSQVVSSSGGILSAMKDMYLKVMYYQCRKNGPFLLQKTLLFHLDVSLVLVSDVILAGRHQEPVPRQRRQLLENHA